MGYEYQIQYLTMQVGRFVYIWARLEVSSRLRNFLWSIQYVSTWTLKSPQMMKEEMRDDRKPQKLIKKVRGK